MRETLTRRGLLTGATVLASGLGVGRLSAAQPAPLVFLLVGDWGVEGEEFQRQVADKMGREGASRNCRFVVSLGDNFYDSGVSSTDDEAWQKSFEQIYTAPSLQVPWYAVLGNHDYHGNPQAQIDYTRKSARWRMPARYFRHSEVTADGSTVDLFFLDTNDIEENYVIHHSGDDDEENRREIAEAQANVAQLGWLEEGLATSKADWKLVFGHHPILSGGEHGPTKELVLAVKPLLERHGVAAYFNGHDHDLQHIVNGSVHYVGCGAGARTRSVSAVEGTLFISDRAGFASVDVDARRLRLVFIDYAGVPLHSALINRPG